MGGPMIADTPLNKVNKDILALLDIPEDCQQTEWAGQFLDATNIHEDDGRESDVGGNEEPEEGWDDGEGDVLREEGHGEDADGGENQGEVDNTERINTGEIREPASQDPAWRLDRVRGGGRADWSLTQGVADTNDGQEERWLARL